MSKRQRQKMQDSKGSYYANRQKGGGEVKIRRAKFTTIK